MTSTEPKWPWRTARPDLCFEEVKPLLVWNGNNSLYWQFFSWYLGNLLGTLWKENSLDRAPLLVFCQDSLPEGSAQHCGRRLIQICEAIRKLLPGQQALSTGHLSTTSRDVHPWVSLAIDFPRLYHKLAQEHIRLHSRSRLLPVQDGPFHPNSNSCWRCQGCWAIHWEYLHAT